MTRLRTYVSEIEAELAAGRLRSLGVEAVIRRDNCGGMRPHLDLQAGVQVFVADADLERGTEILATPTPATHGSWVCPACTETSDGGFDVCWNCGRERD